MEDLLDYYKPFEDFEKSIYKNVFTRVFKENIKDKQLIWHKDRKDRVVKVIYGTGWKLQYDNQLPIDLVNGQTYYVKKESYHRVHKGIGKLVVEIQE